ncbi:branched-chain amino acid ABC transporter substrate-binding protein [Cupriavidus oxalaticus]|uniref:Branched-chain amino acid ABC transporter substrate-binding protein n=1 Tax=Cupriavidus oxalaticus TaxID=96344 RepID=A0ABX7HQ91_9BURK|nr:branched-chain amino acid ABC transporter substrate-binding protein [Cupriavidus oxalaticus]QRQ92646.1 branched-chain amino acid ABC transporter substrate-binding protein [Cupriavidus oxalaticus]
MTLSALAAAAALAVAAAALAQVPAPGQPYLDAPMADAPVAQADPSARIATLTAVEGNLSFAPAGSDQWAATGLNRPVTTGDRLWMDTGGRAELHAGTVAMRMGGATAASILNLDDDTTQVKLTQGTLQVRVRALPQDQTVEIDTPNLAFVPREPGDYRLDVAPDGSTTTVTMRHGSAVVYGDSRSIELQRGDRMRFAGTDLADAGGGPVAEDGFDRWTAARDAREDASPSARYLPREMPGYAALDDYGDWQEEPAYGAVWFPRVVSAGWAPYSVGHWAWIAPWGWTWIDDAPWGFAPSHYGRWAYVGSRWGWVPGPRMRPCYSPAVVAFVGGGSGHGWSSVHVGGGPGVAWYPLGPRDAYRPAYRASPSYVARINRVTVNNFMRGDRGRPAPYANRNVPGAITGMPARNFVEGRPVRGMHRAEWRNLPAGEARGGPPVAPVKSSLVGAAPRRQLPPQARPGFERQAIAARPPGRPATDDLARRFAREGGVVPGAGPAWRGAPEQRPGRPGRPGREAQPMPDVRMSQAALAAREQPPRAGRADPPQGPLQGPDGWRGNGRGQSSRPDDARGFAGQPDAQRQAQAMQREQQQARELQRQQQEAMARRQQEQQRAQQRQWADGQDRPDPARQSQDMQRQRFEQQRQMQEAQQRQAQDAQQRQMQESRQRQAQDAQRQQMEQQRQARDAQRQQMEQQRQARDAQRQQMEQQRQARDAQRQQVDQQRQAAEQQRQQVERQRQMAEQQRQGQEMQRQRFEQQRQMQEAQQRQAQEAQQRQAQAAQRQQMEQQRQMQEQHRQAQEQQRQQAMQRQQAEQQQRAAQAQQRQMQEQQRHQQEQQRQMQDRQRQQMEQQRQQQQRAQHDRGQMEARNRDGDRRQ